MKGKFEIYRKSNGTSGTIYLVMQRENMKFLGALRVTLSQMENMKIIGAQMAPPAQYTCLSKGRI